MSETLPYALYINVVYIHFQTTQLRRENRFNLSVYGHSVHLTNESITRLDANLLVVFVERNEYRPIGFEERVRLRMVVLLDVAPSLKQHHLYGLLLIQGDIIGKFHSAELSPIRVFL